jgi:hypothetical protein
MSKTSSKKDVTICFRTSEDLRNAIEKYAVENNRTLSSMIESILSGYLKKQAGYKCSDQEKRCHMRNPVSVPAFISEVNAESKSYQPGVITDISLGGIQISMRKEALDKINLDNSTAAFEVMFVLPEATQPLNIQCKPTRFVDNQEDVQVGAAFVDSDFKSYQTLQKYLI